MSHTAPVPVTVDSLKLQRDGWLGWGARPTRDYTLRPVVDVVEHLPNGFVVTTDGGVGHIEWEPRCNSRSRD